MIFKRLPNSIKALCGPAAMSRAEPRVAIITGAADGIGLALLDELRNRAGLEKIYATARDPALHSTLVQRARYDDRIELVSMDLTSPASIGAAAACFAASGYVDLVINAAGLLHESGGHAAGATPGSRLAGQSHARVRRERNAGRCCSQRRLNRC